MTPVQEYTLYLLTISIFGIPWCLYNLLELLSGRNPFFTKVHHTQELDTYKYTITQAGVEGETVGGTIESVYPIQKWKKKKYRGLQARP